MKKALTLFLLFFFAIGFINAEAKISDVRCTYLLKKDGNDLCHFYVEIHNYDSSPTLKVLYEKNGSMVDYKGPTSDYQNHNLNPNFTLGFFTNSDKNGYINSYKRDGSCPTLYLSSLTETMQLQDVVETRNVDTSSQPNPLNSTGLYLKSPTDTDWVSESEFKSKSDYEPKTPESGQEDKTCNYKMYFLNTTTPVDVVFKRKFNADSGNVSYTVSIGTREMEIKNLNSDFNHLYGHSEDNTQKNVMIRALVLKTIFTGKDCVNPANLFHYLDDSSGNYYITLDITEVDGKSFSDKMGDGTGAAPKDYKSFTYTEKDPDVDISHESLKCNDLLGNNLLAILRAALLILQIAAAIILIVKGMIMVIPAVAAKDEKKLKEISGKLIIMAIVLLVILLLPTFIKLIGGILGFDLTCFD